MGQGMSHEKTMSAYYYLSCLERFIVGVLKSNYFISTTILST